MAVVQHKVPLVGQIGSHLGLLTVKCSAYRLNPQRSRRFGQLGRQVIACRSTPPGAVRFSSTGADKGGFPSCEHQVPNPDDEGQWVSSENIGPLWSNAFLKLCAYLGLALGLGMMISSRVHAATPTTQPNAETVVLQNDRRPYSDDKSEMAPVSAVGRSLTAVSEATVHVGDPSPGPWRKLWNVLQAPTKALDGFIFPERALIAPQEEGHEERLGRVNSSGEARGVVAGSISAPGTDSNPHKMIVQDSTAKDVAPQETLDPPQTVLGPISPSNGVSPSEGPSIVVRLVAVLGAATFGAMAVQLVLTLAQAWKEERREAGTRSQSEFICKGDTTVLVRGDPQGDPAGVRLSPGPPLPPVMENMSEGLHFSEDPDASRLLSSPSSGTSTPPPPEGISHDWRWTEDVEERRGQGSEPASLAPAGVDTVSTPSSLLGLADLIAGGACKSDYPRVQVEHGGVPPCPSKEPAAEEGVRQQTTNQQPLVDLSLASPGMEGCSPGPLAPLESQEQTSASGTGQLGVPWFPASVSTIIVVNQLAMILGADPKSEESEGSCWACLDDLGAKFGVLTVVDGLRSMYDSGMVGGKALGQLFWWVLEALGDDLEVLARHMHGDLEGMYMEAINGLAALSAEEVVEKLLWSTTSDPHPSSMYFMSRLLHLLLVLLEEGKAVADHCRSENCFVEDKIFWLAGVAPVAFGQSLWWLEAKGVPRGMVLEALKVACENFVLDGPKSRPAVMREVLEGVAWSMIDSGLGDMGEEDQVPPSLLSEASEMLLTCWLPAVEQLELGHMMFLLPQELADPNDRGPWSRCPPRSFSKWRALVSSHLGASPRPPSAQWLLLTEVLRCMSRAVENEEFMGVTMGAFLGNFTPQEGPPRHSPLVPPEYFVMNLLTVHPDQTRFLGWYLQQVALHIADGLFIELLATLMVMAAEGGCEDEDHTAPTVLMSSLLQKALPLHAPRALVRQALRRAKVIALHRNQRRPGTVADIWASSIISVPAKADDKDHLVVLVGCLLANYQESETEMEGAQCDVVAARQRLEAWLSYKLRCMMTAEKWYCDVNEHVVEVCNRLQLWCLLLEDHVQDTDPAADQEERLEYLLKTIATSTDIQTYGSILSWLVSKCVEAIEGQDVPGHLGSTMSWPDLLVALYTRAADVDMDVDMLQGFVVQALEGVATRTACQVIEELVDACTGPLVHCLITWAAERALKRGESECVHELLANMEQCHPDSWGELLAWRTTERPLKEPCTRFYNALLPYVEEEEEEEVDTQNIRGAGGWPRWLEGPLRRMGTDQAMTECTLGILTQVYRLRPRMFMEHLVHIFSMVPPTTVLAILAPDDEQPWQCYLEAAEKLKDLDMVPTAEADSYVFRHLNPSQDPIDAVAALRGALASLQPEERWRLIKLVFYPIVDLLGDCWYCSTEPEKRQWDLELAHEELLHLLVEVISNKIESSAGDLQDVDLCAEWYVSEEDQLPTEGCLPWLQEILEMVDHGAQFWPNIRTRMVDTVLAMRHIPECWRVCLVHKLGQKDMGLGEVLARTKVLNQDPCHPPGWLEDMTAAVVHLVEEQPEGTTSSENLVPSMMLEVVVESVAIAAAVLVNLHVKHLVPLGRIMMWVDEARRAGQKVTRRLDWLAVQSQVLCSSVWSTRERTDYIADVLNCEVEREASWEAAQKLGPYPLLSDGAQYRVVVLLSRMMDQSLNFLHSLDGPTGGPPDELERARVLDPSAGPSLAVDILEMMGPEAVGRVMAQVFQVEESLARRDVEDKDAAGQDDVPQEHGGGEPRLLCLLYMATLQSAGPQLEDVDRLVAAFMYELWGQTTSQKRPSENGIHALLELVCCYRPRYGRFGDQVWAHLVERHPLQVVLEVMADLLVDTNKATGPGSELPMVQWCLTRCEMAVAHLPQLVHLLLARHTNRAGLHLAVMCTRQALRQMMEQGPCGLDDLGDMLCELSEEVVEAICHSQDGVPLLRGPKDVHDDGQWTFSTSKDAAVFCIALSTCKRRAPLIKYLLQAPGSNNRSFHEFLLSQLQYIASCVTGGEHEWQVCDHNPNWRGESPDGESPWVRTLNKMLEVCQVPRGQVGLVYLVALALKGMDQGEANKTMKELTSCLKGSKAELVPIYAGMWVALAWLSAGGKGYYVLKWAHETSELLVPVAALVFETLITDPVAVEKKALQDLVLDCEEIERGSTAKILKEHQENPEVNAKALATLQPLGDLFIRKGCPSCKTTGRAIFIKIIQNSLAKLAIQLDDSLSPILCSEIQLAASHIQEILDLLIDMDSQTLESALKLCEPVGGYPPLAAGHVFTCISRGVPLAMRRYLTHHLVPSTCSHHQDQVVPLLRVLKEGEVFSTEDCAEALMVAVRSGHLDGHTGVARVVRELGSHEEGRPISAQLLQKLQARELGPGELFGRMTALWSSLARQLVPAEVCALMEDVYGKLGVDQESQLVDVLDLYWNLLPGDAGDVVCDILRKASQDGVLVEVLMRYLDSPPSAISPTVLFGKVGAPDCNVGNHRDSCSDASAKGLDESIESNSNKANVHRLHRLADFLTALANRTLPTGRDALTDSDTSSSTDNDRVSSDAKVRQLVILAKQLLGRVSEDHRVLLCLQWLPRLAPILRHQLGADLITHPYLFMDPSNRAKVIHAADLSVEQWRDRLLADAMQVPLASLRAHKSPSDYPLPMNSQESALLAELGLSPSRLPASPQHASRSFLEDPSYCEGCLAHIVVYLSAVKRPLFIDHFSSFLTGDMADYGRVIHVARILEIAASTVAKVSEHIDPGEYARAVGSLACRLPASKAVELLSILLPELPDWARKGVAAQVLTSQSFTKDVSMRARVMKAGGLDLRVVASPAMEKIRDPGLEAAAKGREGMSGSEPAAGKAKDERDDLVFEESNMELPLVDGPFCRRDGSSSTEVLPSAEGLFCLRNGSAHRPLSTSMVLFNGHFGSIVPATGNEGSRSQEPSPEISGTDPSFLSAPAQDLACVMLHELHDGYYPRDLPVGDQLVTLACENPAAFSQCLHRFLLYGGSRGQATRIQTVAEILGFLSHHIVPSLWSSMTLKFTEILSEEVVEQLAKAVVPRMAPASRAEAERAIIHASHDSNIGKYLRRELGAPGNYLHEGLAVAGLAGLGVAMHPAVDDTKVNGPPAAQGEVSFGDIKSSAYPPGLTDDVQGALGGSVMVETPFTVQGSTLHEARAQCVERHPEPQHNAVRSHPVNLEDGFKTDDEDDDPVNLEDGFNTDEEEEDPVSLEDGFDDDDEEEEEEEEDPVSLEDGFDDDDDDDDDDSVGWAYWELNYPPYRMARPDNGANPEARLSFNDVSNIVMGDVEMAAADLWSIGDDTDTDEIEEDQGKGASKQIPNGVIDGLNDEEGVDGLSDEEDIDGLSDEEDNDGPGDAASDEMLHDVYWKTWLDYEDHDESSEELLDEEPVFIDDRLGELERTQRNPEEKTVCEAMVDDTWEDEEEEEEEGSTLMQLVREVGEWTNGSGSVDPSFPTLYGRRVDKWMWSLVEDDEAWE